jgi:hypothetical protein
VRGTSILKEDSEAKDLADHVVVVAVFGEGSDGPSVAW